MEPLLTVASLARMSSPTSPPRTGRQPRMPIEVRREQVLDAALRLILRHGYPAATMEAIAREAQLAKPRVYTAYPGRGPLLLALLEREQQRAITDLAEAMPAFTDDTNFDTTLLAAATSLLNAVTAHPGPWQLLILPANDAPPEVQQHAQGRRQFALQQLRALLEWGRHHRPGLAELDLELLARTLLAVGEDAVRLILTQPDQFTAQRYNNYLRDLLKMWSPRTI
jgi:AcrR family transcriptional regulator